jgi:hypothetical protein
MWIYNIPSPIRLHGVVLKFVEHRDNFSFFTISGTTAWNKLDLIRNRNILTNSTQSHYWSLHTYVQTKDRGRQHKRSLGAQMV